MREGLFRRDEFRYDAERDAYVCPAGKLLTPIRHGGCAISRRSTLATRKPAVIARCARCTNDISSVSRLENEEALDRVGSAAALQT